MVQLDLRLLVMLSALCLCDLATKQTCRIGAVRLIVLIGLGCLTWLHSDWSMPHSVMPESRIEGLGGKLWGTNNGSSAAARTSVNAFGMPGDNCWEEHYLCGCFLRLGKTHVICQALCVT